jgi:hypothetical protein
MRSIKEVVGHLLTEHFRASESNVDIIIQRRQTTQEIETKESVTLIEISIHTAIPGKLLVVQRTIERIKDLLEQVCEKQRINNNLKAKLF